MATRRNPTPGLFKVTAKGRTYYYAFRGGPRIEAEYGSPEFLEEYLAARSPETNLDRSRFGAWVGLYKASDDYKKLADSTKKNWAPKLDAIKAHFGKFRSGCSIARPSERTSDIGATSGALTRAWPTLRSRFYPASARSPWPRARCRRIRARAYRTSTTATVARSSGRPMTWTRSARWRHLRSSGPLGSRLSRAFGKAICSSSRGPCRRPRDHAEDRQEPGPALGPDPDDPGPTRAAGPIPKRALTVLTNTNGEPWKTGFGASWQAAIKRAKLADKDLHFHDLRGTAATNYYRADFGSRDRGHHGLEQGARREADRYLRQTGRAAARPYPANGTLRDRKSQN